MTNKRSIIIDGKVTSICMEAAFWHEVDRRAEMSEMPWQNYMRQLLDSIYDAPNRSAALRECLLRQLVGETEQHLLPQSRWLLDTPLGRSEKTTFGSRLFVGRDPSCDIVVDDIEASRRHLMLSFDGECWWAIDLESKNGLRLGRKKVAVVKLIAGVVICFGQSKLSYLG